MSTARLSPLSAAFLEAEDADPEASLAIGSITVFEGPRPTFEEFSDAIAGRLPLLSRYRQKLRPVPFDLAAPLWVDDPDFDLGWHLRHTAVPAPGGDDDLARLMSRVMSRRMDRGRPLWEYWFVEGLAEGHWALISKIHHSLVDGVSGTDIYRLILDPGPEPAPGVPDTWVPQPPPSTARVLAGAGWELVTTPAAAVRRAVASLGTPRRLARRTARSLHGALALAGAVRPAGASSLVGALDGSRRFAWTTVSMRDVGAVRERFGGSVNDVALAVISGGFRALLLDRGEEPSEHSLRSLLPVSVRKPGEESIRDNRVSLMLPYLPVDVADPVARLEAIHERVAALRDAGEVEAGESLTELARFGPFSPVALGMRVAFHLPQRWISTVTTNVPGPRVPLYALGRRVVRIIPYVPIADRVRVGIAIFSYCDELTFGVTGDYATSPDLAVLAEGISRSLEELLEAAAPAAQDTTEVGS